MPARVPQRVLPIRGRVDHLAPESPEHTLHEYPERDAYPGAADEESTTSATCNLFAKSKPSGDSTDSVESPSGATPTTPNKAPSPGRLRRQATSFSFKKQVSPRRAPTADFMRRHSAIVRQLAAREKAKGCTLKADSPLLARWDLLTALALVYTALLTPFEVAFLETPETMLNPWFVLIPHYEDTFLTHTVCTYLQIHHVRVRGVAVGSSSIALSTVSSSSTLGCSSSSSTPRRFMTSPSLPRS